MFERQILFETITVFRYKPLKNPGKKFIRGGWGGGGKYLHGHPTHILVHILFKIWL